MSDDTHDHEHDETVPDDQPVEEAAAPEQPAEQPAAEPAAAAAPRRTFRERLVGARGLIAVGAATLILGGVGGYAVGAITSDGPGDHGRDHEHGRPFDDAGRGELPPGAPGGLPPTTPEDGAPAQPEGSSATNGSTT